MNWNLLGGSIGAIAIVGGAAMFLVHLSEETYVPDYSTIDTTNAITELKVTHSFAQGVHMYRGVIPTPTPCYTIAKNVEVAESFPEQILVEFQTKRGSEYCAQVVANIPFEVSAKASEKATVTMTLNGYSVLVDLTEVETDAVIENAINSGDIEDATSSTTEWVDAEAATTTATNS